MEYNKDYYLKAYDYIRDETDYLIRAIVAHEKYFKDIPFINSKKVLEIGAGLGKNIYCLKQAYAHDTSPFAKAFCKKKNITVVDSITPQDYDVIVLIHSLEHMEKPSEFLKLIYKKMKRGSMFLLVLPLETHKYVSDFKPDNNNHLFSWNFRSINNLLSLAGFTILKNEFVFEGIGYKLLKPLYKKYPLFFYRLTRVVTKLFFRHQRELKILAVKR